MVRELTKEEKEQILRLRRIREDMGYSQEQFAEILEIGVSYYRKIELYERQISLPVLKKIYNKLGVSADYILYGKHKLFENVWKEVLNCNEKDKWNVFIRLYHYFIYIKKGVFYIEHEGTGKKEKLFDAGDGMKKTPDTPMDVNNMKTLDIVGDMNELEKKSDSKYTDS